MSQLERAVDDGFAVTARGLAHWPDPHPDRMPWTRSTPGSSIRPSGGSFPHAPKRGAGRLSSWASPPSSVTSPCSGWRTPPSFPTGASTVWFPTFPVELRDVPEDLLSFRELPGATWTGEEFVVFGGDAESSCDVDDPPAGEAAAYDPDGATLSWPSSVVVDRWPAPRDPLGRESGRVRRRCRPAAGPVLAVVGPS